MEIGSIAIMPGDKVAVTTRRGDLWICEGAYGADLSQVKWTRFAHGLHEPLGMYWKDGSLYLTQRPEFSRLQDTDGDGSADVFETINSDWGINGDYHEYAFGTSPDKNGDVWITLCLTGSAGAASDWRG
jgi:glucose/arabinose dehydrogenase